MASATATEEGTRTASPTLGSPSSATSRYLDSAQSPQCPIERDVSGASIIVVMGVSGTGKSTLGKALGKVMHLPFIDGDDLHPAENVAKMGRGEPLADRDRWPWLETVRRTAVGCVMAQADGSRTNVGVIVACSALKKTYRAVLRGEASESLPTYFVYLKGNRDVLMGRMERRRGHFMKAGMLESQLDTLESPEGEQGVVTVEVNMSTEEQVQRVVEMLSL